MLNYDQDLNPENRERYVAAIASAVEENSLVREITHIDVQQFTNMQSYRTKCTELVRKIKEQSIPVEEILIYTYSMLYGLGPEYDAYKLIVQDKIDNKMKPTVESIIESFTNSKEVLTYVADRGWFVH